MRETRILTSGDIDGIGPSILAMAGSTVLAAATGLKPGTRTGVYYASSRILSLLQSGELEGIAHSDAGSVDGLLLWQELPWDTEATGARCARIVMAAGGGLGDMFGAWNGEAERRGVEYTTIRIPEGHSTMMEKKQILAGAGFERLEKMVYLASFTGAGPKRRDAADAPAELRQASKDDMEEIGEMAARSYSYDRFHKDSFFSRETADNVHVKWIRDSFAGRADAILVAVGRGGEITGYCTCMLPAGAESFSGWIDMLAVRCDCRGRGIGKSLLRGALGWMHDARVLSAALCTQDDNKPALGLYGKAGFDPFMTAVTWRRALSGGAGPENGV